MNRLRLRRDPVRLLLSSGPWSALGYLAGYQLVGWLLFSIALTAGLTSGGLGITLAGLPLLIGAAAVIRWCAQVERLRLRPFCGAVPAGYRSAAGHHLLARVGIHWRDPAIWRDIAYLIGMFVPLVTLDSVVLAVWLVLLAGITLPAWYWAPWHTINGVRYHGVQLGYFPNGPHGHPGYGLYLDTLPKALLAALVCLVGFLLFNYVLVATARAHIAVARNLLAAPVDPLAAAKEVLSRPGPLSLSTAEGRPEGASPPAIPR
jgi:hypothetical protein